MKIACFDNCKIKKRWNSGLLVFWFNRFAAENGEINPQKLPIIRTACDKSADDFKKPQAFVLIRNGCPDIHMYAE